uniref:RUN domain-containing protein n=1 Tax=Timema poppense TaxID=170557 RepID=A0A7R9H2E6_TIMPO|nr:unnamed protein product [Timema poppensis]
MIQLLLFGEETSEEDFKSKNIKQTEILVDLREAVLQVARHFMSVDPKLSKVVLVPDYSMESHSLDQDNYINVSRNRKRRAKALLEEICDGLRSESFREEGQDGGEDDNEVELEPVVSLIGALRAFKTMRAFVYGHDIIEKDFERHDDDELGFRKNDIITIVSQKERALLGWFPAKFVELLDERSKQYSCAGDDSVSEAVTDLVRGILCPAVKQVLEHGMKKPNILGGPCHPWLFIEEAATKEVERDFNSVYSRLVLCKTYRLDEDGKVLTPEELMYRCVQAVNQTHDDAHSQMDVKLRSLICLGLNEQVLHLWLEVLYYPWSFLNSPGWVQIKCELRVLSQFAFNLNPDWELPPKKEQSQPLKDGVRDMLVKHHLFSWDL